MIVKSERNARNKITAIGDCPSAEVQFCYNELEN